jgi:hypothetical protein
LIDFRKNAWHFLREGTMYKDAVRNSHLVLIGVLSAEHASRGDARRARMLLLA